MGLVVLGLAAGLVAGGTLVAARDTRRSRLSRAVMSRVEQIDHPLVCVDGFRTRFRITRLNAERTPWQPFVTALTPSQIAFYPVHKKDIPPTVFPVEGLRWFGRPKKYSAGANEIWLHIEKEGCWFLVQMNLFENRMRPFVRALKEVATEEQVIAYRRHRPYIHFGPAPAYPAAQDMQGAWALGAPLHLYLTPLFLVLLDGSTVKRTIALDQVQKVAAIRRLDQPRAMGLVRFEVSGEPLAFSVNKHERFAKALAEAARRTLEDPVEWQRKKKKKEWAADEDMDEGE